MAPKYPVSPSLVRSSADRTFAVWTEGISVFTNSQRIMVQSFSGAGELARPELDLTSFVSSVADLSAQPDGQDGLLLSWYQEAAFEVAHVLADGTVAAGPFVANPSGLGALAPSRNGGYKLR